MLTSVRGQQCNLCDFNASQWIQPLSAVLHKNCPSCTLAAGRENAILRAPTVIVLMWSGKLWVDANHSVECVQCVCVCMRATETKEEIFLEGACACVCAQWDTCLVLSGCMSPLWLLCKPLYSPAVKSLHFHLNSWPSSASSTLSYPPSHLPLSFVSPTFYSQFPQPFLTSFSASCLNTSLPVYVHLLAHPSTMLIGMPYSSLLAAHK